MHNEIALMIPPGPLHVDVDTVICRGDTCVALVPRSKIRATQVSPLRKRPHAIALMILPASQRYR